MSEGISGWAEPRVSACQPSAGFQRRPFKSEVAGEHSPVYPARGEWTYDRPDEDRAGWADWRRQAGCGRRRSRTRARLNLSPQGQCCGRCKVRRRAEQVSRPASEKKRRLRVFVVRACSFRPMLSRAVQKHATGAE